MGYIAAVCTDCRKIAGLSIVWITITDTHLEGEQELVATEMAVP